MKLPENLSHWKQTGYDPFAGQYAFRRSDGDTAYVSQTGALLKNFDALLRHDELHPLPSTPAESPISISLFDSPHWKGVRRGDGRAELTRSDGTVVVCDLGRVHDEIENTDRECPLPTSSTPAPARLPESLGHWKQTEYDYPAKGYAFRRDDGELAFASNADVAKGDFRALLRHDELRPTSSTPAPAQPDMVAAPPHYTSGGVEVIDVIRAKLSPEEYRGFVRGNAVKYLLRMGLKGSAAEDARKAQVYLGWLVESLTSATPASGDSH